jgi:pilus assembly protein CpaF
VSFSIVITEKGGKPRQESFEQNEITIGRVQDNDIVLPKGNISKRHSRIVLRDGKFIIVDLKSTNGTFVNGKRISSPMVLKDQDKIYIGDFTLQLEALKVPAVAEVRPPTPAPGAKPGVPGEDLVDDPLFDPPSDGEAIAKAVDNEVIDPVEEPVPPAQPRAMTPPPVPKKPEVQPRERKQTTPPPPNPEPAIEIARRPPRETRKGVDLQVELPPMPALQARAAVFATVFKNVPLSDAGLPSDDEQTLEKVRTAVEKALSMQQKRLAGAGTDGWSMQIAREVCGFGPLTELLEDPAVVEVFVNGPHQIVVRRAPDSSSIGIPLTPVNAFFSSEDAAALVIRRIMHAAGLKFDADHPIAECRMADGTRVNAVHHAASVRGPVVTISRTSTRSAKLEDLVAEGMLSKGMASFLELCVRARKNVAICGGAGTGTGTLLGALAATIPDEERVVVVEQVARLKLPQQHVITLEPRPLKGGPSGATMRDLVANALRMRPNRLIVNEVNGPEALELSMAMAGRQDGTLFTTYAGTARDCLDRLETMIRMAGLDVQSRVVREQISSSVEVVVAMTRFADGTSRVTQIAEVTGIEVDLVKTQDIFLFKRERVDEGGSVVGRFQPTGTAPRFYEELQRRGDEVDLDIIRE